MRFLLLVVVCFFPLTTYAAVTLSEIAWMGTTQDPNGSYCEWIELFNSDTSEVSLDGWTLSFGTVAIIFDTTASIAGNGYFVVERYTENACPDPVPNRTDFSGSFGSGIANTGAVLKLVRADGGLEDQFSSNDNWENQGDNTSKETVQYTDSGWVTSGATPGSGLTGYTPQEIAGDTVQTSGGGSTASSKKASVQLKPKPQYDDLSLVLATPQSIYVHQPVTFTVTPSGPGKTILDSLKYEWNFGDASTSTSKTPTHTFEDAGEYVVVVYAAFAEQEQMIRKTVTVLPVSFSISRNSDGDILLHNNAKYEADISNYTIKGGTSFVFPKRSFMLPNATLTILKDKLQSPNGATVVLYDQQHTIVALGNGAYDASQTNALSLETERTATVPETPLTESENFSFPPEVLDSEEAVVATSGIVSTDTEALGQTAAVADSATGIPKETLPYLGLGGILTIGILSVFVGRTRRLF
jgi:hypothetical protein